jgi:glycosyltransferase involved in cell wall biosynthesis
MSGPLANPVVSAIVPAYKRPESLRSAVLSLLAQDLDSSQYEIIVIDSSPDDANAGVLAEIAAKTETDAGPKLRWFRKKPEGPGPSRNLGAQEARGEILAFLDSDCQASPKWLRSGLAAFEEGTGIVQGRTAPQAAVPHHFFNRTLEVGAESFLYETANIFYRREAFEQGGGFPPDLAPADERPYGGEDVTLAWTVKRAGWKTRFAPEALVEHDVRRFTFKDWLIDHHLYIVPHLIAKFPELRRYFWGRYFFDRYQAALVLAFVGCALAVATPFTLTLAVPYFVVRSGEPSRTLRGPLRLARAFLYLPRDTASFCVLVAGSVRFGTLLL